jgi:5-methylcytosine-specific restriction endonuclease McrA
MRVKDQILELRKLGYSYPEIQKKLQCSKGTISYHCGEGQKNKTANRRISNRNKQHPLSRKVENFIKNIPLVNRSSKQTNRTINKILYQKIAVFSRINSKDYNYMSFTVEELLQKIGDNPICGLTGRPIDLINSRSYQLDHIVPRSKGGSNTLDNCQLACREANQAKHELTVDEFVSLCREVVEYFDSNK